MSRRYEKKKKKKTRHWKGNSSPFKSASEELNKSPIP